MSRKIWVFHFSSLALGCLALGCQEDDSGDADDGSSDDDTEALAFAGDSGEFTDARDQKTYRWVRIGDQVWMAENLRFMPEDGEGVFPPRAVRWTGEEEFPLGMYYSWVGIMDADPYYLTWLLDAEEPQQGLCPSGWHIPSHADWQHLAENVNELLGPFTLEEHDWSSSWLEWQGMGTVLKAPTGWTEGTTGTDDLGFSAYPDGYMYGDDDGSGMFWTTYYWSSTEMRVAVDAEFPIAYSVGLSTDDDVFDVGIDVFEKDYCFPIRCLKD